MSTKSWFQDPFNTSMPTRKREKTNTSTSTTSSGSAAGEAAGQWGLNQYQGMMDPTAYGGNVPGAQGPNAAQNQQYNMLTGMQSGYGSPGGYQDMYKNLSGANAQQLGPMDRSGGPGAGYMNPYQDQMIGGLERDLKRANAMGANQIGGGASGANAFGGARHGVAEGVMSGENARNFMDGATRIRSDSYDKGMQYQGQDQNRNIQIANANNQANLGFGNMNMNAASGDINNRRNIAGDFGNYGQNQQNQQNMADTFNYGEFNRMQDWKPNMMNNYMSGVRGTPWQQTSTTSAMDNSSQTGQGNKSNFEKSLGLGLTVKGYMKCIPEGTKIDTQGGGQIAIEDIKAGTKVKGYYKAETEVLQVHQYKEDRAPHRFYRITFDNGGTVDCCDMHKIYNKPAKDYRIGDRIQNTKVTSIGRYNGVERSYDLLTADGGYLIGGVPVNSMIEELAELTAELKQAAEAAA
jgi:hypothetical protein